MPVVQPPSTVTLPETVVAGQLGELADTEVTYKAVNWLRTSVVAFINGLESSISTLQSNLAGLTSTVQAKADLVNGKVPAGQLPAATAGGTTSPAPPGSWENPHTTVNAVRNPDLPVNTYAVANPTTIVVGDNNKVQST